MYVSSIFLKQDISVGNEWGALKRGTYPTKRHISNDAPWLGFLWNKSPDCQSGLYADPRQWGNAKEFGTRQTLHQNTQTNKQTNNTNKQTNVQKNNTKEFYTQKTLQTNKQTKKKQNK